VRLAGLRTGRLDHVRIDRTLREEFHALELVRFLVEDLDEQPADDFALGFGVRDARERREEALAASTRMTRTPRLGANTAITWSPSW